MKRVILSLLIVSGCLGCTDKKREPGAVSVQTFPESVTVAWKDTADIHRLVKQAYAAIPFNIDSSIILYEDVLRLSRFIEYAPGAATAYNSLIFLYNKKGDFEKASHYTTEGINFLKQAIPTAKQMHQYRDVQKLYAHLIAFYINQYAFRDIITTYYAALPFYDPKDSASQASFMKMTLSLASAYFSLEAYDSASNMYMSLLQYCTPPNQENYATLHGAYQGLGAIMGRISSPDKALSYLKKGEYVAQQFRDTALFVQALSNIGTLYQERVMFKEAKEYAFRALSLSEKINNQYANTGAKFQNNYTIAACLVQENQPAEALPYSKAALSHALLLNKHTAAAYYLLGSNYIYLKQYKDAERYLSQSAELAQHDGNTDKYTAVTAQLGILYARMGQYKKAYEFKSTYITLKDSIRSSDNAKRIAEADAKYRIAQKDKQLAENKLLIAHQQLNIRNQHIWFGGVVAATLITILILMMILRRKKYQSEMERIKAIMSGEEQERTRLARELHDGILSQLSIIKTTISSLSMQYNEPEGEDPFKEAIEQLDQGIVELRATSHNLLPEILQQAGLVGALESYCRKLSQSRLIDLDFQMVGILPPLTEDFQLNVYRMIQEIINNIIKHSGATTALIQFVVRDQSLEITIDDNGSAWHTEDLSAENGIGMHNLNSRLRLLEGKMEMERTEGTSIYLTFSLKKFISSLK